MGEFFAMYGEMLGSTERVDLQFSLNQMKTMKDVARRAGKGSVSTQDALAAYLITVLNRVEPDTPCTQIMNVVDVSASVILIVDPCSQPSQFRGAPVSSYNSTYKPPSISAAGNLTITHFSDDLPPSTYASSTSSPFSKGDTSLGEIAAFVRSGVATTKSDGEYVRRVIALSEELYPRSASAGRLQWWFPYPVTRDTSSSFSPSSSTHHKEKRGTTVAINNLYKVRFPALAFAAPSASVPDPCSRFYSFDSWAHYLRIWPGNPTRDPRTGRWERNEGSARTFFRVKIGLGDKVREIVKKDFEGWKEGADIRAKL